MWTVPSDRERRHHDAGTEAVTQGSRGSAAGSGRHAVCDPAAVPLRGHAAFVCLAWQGCVGVLALWDAAMSDIESDATVPRALCEYDYNHSPACSAVFVYLDGERQKFAMAYDIDAGWVRALDPIADAQSINSDRASTVTMRGRVVVKWNDDEHSRRNRAAHESGNYPTCADLLSGREL